MSRSLGMHDTSEFERHQRGARRAFLYGVVPPFLAVLYGFAHSAQIYGGAIARATLRSTVEAIEQERRDGVVADMRLQLEGWS